MGQGSFTILTAVRAGQVSDLEALLNDIGDNLDRNADLHFEKFPTLHYASFAVLDDGVTDPSLVFAGNVDGNPHVFLQDLVDAAGEGVNMIYRHCIDFPSTDPQTAATTLEYLKAHDQQPNATYVAWPGRSVDEINRDQQLRDRIEEFLDDEWQALRDQPPRVIKDHIRDRIDNDPNTRWTLTSPPNPVQSRHGNVVILVMSAAATLTLAGLLKAALTGSTRRRRIFSRAVLVLSYTFQFGVVGTLMVKERLDPSSRWQISYANWIAGNNLDRVVRHEDVSIQNHMVSVTKIKPGMLRLSILQLVLFVLNYITNLSFNQVSLGGIGSTHFARWIITPDRDRLIFISNFDGSWESYVSNYVDLAPSALTAVWSNTQNALGFPRTRLLLFEGAMHEAQFKAFARYSMVPTNAWYSAYPDLTVGNIQNNVAILNGLSRPLDDYEARAWLRRL